ncbi:MAG: SpoIIIAH-like family protein [Clostridia bacterium]|nr:SpoIIIAH-like family protein [Clostridia bacterium]
MKVLKRNQIIISVLALMLITVGYMSFSNNMHNSVETGALMDAEKMAGIGDAKLVNSNTVNQNNNGNDDLEIELEDESNQENSNDNNPGAIQTAESGINNTNGSNNTSASSTSTGSTSTEKSTENNNTQSTKTTSTTTYQADYFVASRLERDKMYSQMLESYQGLVENSNIAADQKNISTQEIAKINNKKNSIMIAENLIKNLGFEDVVIFVNDNSTSVIVKAEKLSEADIAQIQNIVCREIGVKVEDIHISVK